MHHIWSWRNRGSIVELNVSAGIGFRSKLGLLNTRRALLMIVLKTSPVMVMTLFVQRRRQVKTALKMVVEMDNKAAWKMHRY